MSNIHLNWIQGTTDAVTEKGWILRAITGRSASRELHRRGMRDNEVLLKPLAARTHPSSVSNANPMTDDRVIFYKKR